MKELTTAKQWKWKNEMGNETHENDKLKNERMNIGNETMRNERNKNGKQQNRKL